MSENEEKSLDPLLALSADARYVWQMLCAIVESDPSVDRIKARDTALRVFGQLDELRAANARADGGWRDPVTDAPEIGQRVLVAHKMGRHTVVGAATYWNYKKGVHDDDSGPDWQLHEYDFLGTIVAWKEMPEYTPPTPGSEVQP